MTQAYNLSQLANNLNSSGQLDATDGLVNAVPVANGGTGASTTSAARTNLGLGSIATQSSSNVSITGGSITGITDLAIADGGTGASTAAGARTNLDVPSTSGSGATGTWAINISGTSANGGVSSVNAQTGAVVNTGYGDIGSYVIGMYPLDITQVLAAGATVNGSDLYRMNDPSDGSNEFLALNTRAGGTIANAASASQVVSLGLTGTWRAMTRLKNANAGSGIRYVLGLFVRVS